MKTSEERILTTHAGSLPRTPALTDLLVRREQGKPFDQAAFDREVDRALDIVVGKQLDCGLDIGNDGEMPRIGFSTYVAERMSGFGGESCAQHADRHGQVSPTSQPSSAARSAPRRTWRACGTRRRRWMRCATTRR